MNLSQHIQTCVAAKMPNCITLSEICSKKHIEGDAIINEHILYDTPQAIDLMGNTDKVMRSKSWVRGNYTLSHTEAEVRASLTMCEGPSKAKKVTEPTNNCHWKSSGTLLTSNQTLPSPWSLHHFTLISNFYPSALWAGEVLSSRSWWAGSCQIYGTHISVTAWRIFSIQNSVELSRPVVVHCQGHLPICAIWACPWAKNLSNLPQIGSRLCGTHISETAGWIHPI